MTDEELLDLARERLGLSLTAPDAHLVTLRSRMPGLLVPSKIYGILAAGRPTLYVGPTDGEIADGHGKRQIVIDESADEAQRGALETIISGEACEPMSNFFSVFAATCSAFCETLFLPIDLQADLDARTAKLRWRQQHRQRRSHGHRRCHWKPHHLRHSGHQQRQPPG